MPSIDLASLCGRYLSFQEREEIAVLKAQGAGIRQIARRLGRDPSTISRELRRNAATRGGTLDYRASVAQWKAELLAQRPKTAKLVANERLREYVQERLASQDLLRKAGRGSPLACRYLWLPIPRSTARGRRPTTRNRLRPSLDRVPPGQ
jgi:hypothetical protein